MTLPSSDPWTCAMQRGDFAQAWRVCDQVLAERRGWDCSAWPRHLQYVWDGTPVEGARVLVRCYHGLGDTIQFVRLLAPLRERARHVALWVQPALIGLLRDVRGADELLPLHDEAPPAGYDVDLELMELPHVLRLLERDLPGKAPYIYVSAEAETRARDGLRVSCPASRARSLRVGLVWRSGEWNTQRSIPADALTELARIHDVQWCSLQYPRERPPFELREMACRDIRDLAARMRTLDLVVSVDTMTAHLAGALGLRVWTLLASECDWRWMTGRCDSPWYPTMRLFRQVRPNDWGGAIDAVFESLSRLARDPRPRAGHAIPAPDTRSAGCTASSG